MDSLIKCVGQNLGFSQGTPVAAITIYRCLVHWKSFEAEKTSVFDRLIPLIGSAMEVLDFYQLSIFITRSDPILNQGTKKEIFSSTKPEFQTI